MCIWASKYSRNDISLVISMVICWLNLRVPLSNRPGIYFAHIELNGLEYSFCVLFCFSRRPAFAPIYGNQYSSQANQSWANAGSQYVSAGNAGAINKRGLSDSDAALANNIRKEKRQYKKRKHKNQRDKPPYPTPGTSINHSVSISYAPNNIHFLLLCRRTDYRCHGIVR